MDLRVRRALARYARDKLVVAVSGGVDSLVLLHVLCRLHADRLHVATLDHGLRGSAGAADAAFVSETAAAWGVPVTVERADVPAYAVQHHLGIEAAARAVRYAFLERVAQQTGAAAVATGHTQDDQAETMLLHLIRGSGLEGLGGMPRHRALGTTTLIRPLLDVSRAEIAAYAAEHGLHPREDVTNTDPAYLRNRVRRDVIPLLAELNPNIRATLARAADVLRADAAYLDSATQAALADLVQERTPDRIVFDLARWQRLPLSQQRASIRMAVRWLRPNLQDVGFEPVEQAVIIAEQGKTGQATTLPGGLHLRVISPAVGLIGTPEALRLDAPALETAFHFAAGDPVRLQQGDWVFESGPLGPGHDLDALHADPLAAVLYVPPGARLDLRTRQPGDRFRPRGMGGHSQKLSDTLINMQVPAFTRDRLPLLAVDGAVAWFVALTADGLRGRVAEPFAVPPILGDWVSIVVHWEWLNTPFVF